MPSLTLWKPKRGGAVNRKKIDLALSDRIHHAQSELFSQNSQDEERQSQSPSQSSATSLSLSSGSSVVDAETIAVRQQKFHTIKNGVNYDQQIRNIRRAKNFLNDGHYSRAVKALLNKPLPIDAVEEEHINKLRQLHPQPAAQDQPLPSLPSTNAHCTIDWKDAQFIRLINRSANGSAPGLSGWTGEMVRVLTDNEECLKGLAALISDITNGDLPAEAKPFILSSQLIATPKPSGGLRPIAIGEVFYKLATLRAQQLTSPVAAELLQPIQLGVGVSGGCEIAIHTLQHALTQPSEPFAALSIDFRNAFNERSRADILSLLFKEKSLEQIWKLCHFAYSEPSDLFVRDQSTGLLRTVNGLSSAEGVRQGDPLSSILFALSMKEIYSLALAAQPLPSSSDIDSLPVEGIAIHDDLSFFGPADKLIPVFNRIKELAARGGLTVQTSKCKFLYFHQDSHPLSDSVTNFIQNNCFEFIQDATILLGSPIGKAPAAVEKLVEQIVTDQQELFEAISNDNITVHEAMLLLRMCGVPRLNYLIRTCRPFTTTQSAKKFDQQLLTTATNKLNIPNQTSTNDILSLPIHHGGFGLTRSSEIADAAWFSSIVNTFKHYSSYWRSFIQRNPGYFNRVANDSSSSSSSSITPFSLVEQLEHSIQAIHNNVDSKSKHLIPASTNEFLAFCNSKGKRSNYNANATNPHLQKLLSTAIKTKKVNAMKAAMKGNLVATARYNSVSSADSSRWLTVIPSQPEFQLSNAEYRSAARLRLGLPTTNQQPVLTRCPLCLKSTRYTATAGLPDSPIDQWHCFSCNKLKPTSITDRHDFLVNIIRNWCDRVGITVRKEPRRLNNDNRRRPDLLMYTEQQKILVDVQVVHPTCSSHLQSSAADNPTTIETAERNKKRKYSAMALKQQAKFVPFIVDTFGQLGKDAKELIGVIATAAHNNSNSLYSYKGVKQDLLSAVAVGIQRGNAMVLNDAFVKYDRALIDQPSPLNYNSNLDPYSNSIPVDDINPSTPSSSSSSSSYDVLEMIGFWDDETD